MPVLLDREKWERAISSKCSEWGLGKTVVVNGAKVTGPRRHTKHCMDSIQLQRNGTRFARYLTEMLRFMQVRLQCLPILYQYLSSASSAKLPNLLCSQPFSRRFADDSGTGNIGLHTTVIFVLFGPDASYNASLCDTYSGDRACDRMREGQSTTANWSGLVYSHDKSITYGVGYWVLGRQLAYSRDTCAR